MPNLDSLLAAGRRTVTIAPRSSPPVTLGRLDHHDDRLLARRGHGVFDHRYYDVAGRPDEGQPRGARPGADVLAPALAVGPLGGSA